MFGPATTNLLVAAQGAVRSAVTPNSLFGINNAGITALSRHLGLMGSLLARGMAMKAAMASNNSMAPLPTVAATAAPAPSAGSAPTPG